MAKRINNNWLVFVDTNILLDFYRKDGADAVKQIAALNRHKERLILTDQVFMEFLKNRQTVIASAMREIKRPEVHKFPPILRDFASVSSVEKEIKSATRKIESLVKKNSAILTDPKKNDPVFKSVSTIFESRGPYFLKRDAQSRFRIRRLAQKRFFLGYPPRKSGDTSIGDAINWEWIVHCAVECKRSSHVMIVSRDGDYGFRDKDASYLNDWLVREFKERVGKERKISLTARLTEALKLLSETVTKKEEQAEQELLEKSPVEPEQPPSVFD